MLKCKSLFFILLACYSLTALTQTILTQQVDSLLNKYDTDHHPGLAVSIIKNNDILYS
ncbi:MAG: hypothetical protein ACJAR4_001572 [Psychroserpens sp.]|jgi:hypothetical protein